MSDAAAQLSIGPSSSGMGLNRMEQRLKMYRRIRIRYAVSRLSAAKCNCLPHAGYASCRAGVAYRAETSAGAGGATGRRCFAGAFVATWGNSRTLKEGKVVTDATRACVRATGLTTSRQRGRFCH